MPTLSDLQILIAELKKNTLATICGLLIAAVGSLVMHIVAREKKSETKEDVLQENIHNLQIKLLTVERFWSDRVDGIRIEQIKEVREILKKQDQIDADQKRLKKVNK